MPPSCRCCSPPRAQLAASADHSDRIELSEETEARLEAHRDRYTMQKENTSHAMVVVTKAASTRTHSGPEIELFSSKPAQSETPAALVKPATAVKSAHSKNSPAPTTITTAENLGDGIELF